MSPDGRYLETHGGYAYTLCLRGNNEHASFYNAISHYFFGTYKSLLLHRKKYAPFSHR